MLASSRSAGKTIQFKGKEYVVEQMTDKSFDRVDIALFSAGADRSKTRQTCCAPRKRAYRSALS